MEIEALEDARLRRQRREWIFDPSTRRHIGELDLRHPCSCLEVGAGFGSIAAWLLEQPGVRRVVATDIRSEYLDVLRPLQARGIEVWEHDITRDELPQAIFDLVHARFVLEHLPARDQVIGRLVSTTRPGGWLLIEDAEFSVCQLSDSGAYRKAMEAFSAAMALTGTDYPWSALLPTRLAEAGLSNITGSGEVRWFRGGSEEAMFWAANLIELQDRYVSANLLTQSELEAAVAVMADDPSWLPAPMTVTAVGQVRGA